MTDLSWNRLDMDSIQHFVKHLPPPEGPTRQEAVQASIELRAAGILSPMLVLAQRVAAMNPLPPEDKMARVIDELATPREEKTPRIKDFEQLRLMVLKTIETDGSITTSGLSSSMGVTRHRARTVLQNMIHSHEIVKIGKNKGTRYVLANGDDS